MPLKELGVRITATSAELDKALRDAEDKVQAVGRRLEGLGRNLSTRVTLPILAIGGASLKMASDAEEGENLFNVALGSMSEAGRTFSDELSRALGLNAIKVRENIGVFQSMFDALGIGEDAAFAMSSSLAQLSEDMASLRNISPEAAFEKLQSGIAGMSRPLRQFGIDVSETATKEFALEQGLIRAGEAMTQTQKAIARYLLIISRTKNEQGDLARTTDSIANLMRRVMNSFVRAGIALGQILAPAFRVTLKAGVSVLDSMTEMLERFKELPGPVKTAAVALVALAASIGPVLLGLGGLIKLWGLLKATFVVGKVALVAAASSFGPLLLAIGAVATAGFFLIRNWQTVRVRWAEIWLNLLIGTQKDVDTLLDLLEPVSRAIPGLFGKLDGLRDRVGEQFTTAVRRSRQELTQLRRELAATAGEEGAAGPDPADFQIDLDAMLERLRAAFDAAGGAGEDGAQKVEKAMDGLRGALAAAESRSQLLGESYDVAGAKAQAYQKAIDALVEAGVDPASDSIQELRRQLLRFSEQAVRTEALNTYNAKLDEARRRQRLFGDEISMAAVRADALRERIETLTEAGISEQDAEVQRLVAEYDRWAGRMRTIEDLSRRAEANREFLKRIREDAAAAVRASREAAASLHTAQIVSGFEQAQEAAGRMADAVGRFFEDIVTASRSVVDAFADMVDGILRELARLLVQQSIVGPLFNLLLNSIPVPRAPGPIDLPAPPDVNVPTISEVPEFNTRLQVSAVGVRPSDAVLAQPSPIAGPAAAGAGGGTFSVHAPVTVEVRAFDMRGAAAVADQIGDIAAEKVFRIVEQSRAAESRLRRG